MSWCHARHVRIFRDERWRPSYVYLVEDHDSGDEDCCPPEERVVNHLPEISEAAAKVYPWTSSET